MGNSKETLKRKIVTACSQFIKHRREETLQSFKHKGEEMLDETVAG